MGEERGEGGLACNFPLARAGPLLRTTIAHSVTTKLAPFSQHKTGKTVEREREGEQARPSLGAHNRFSENILVFGSSTSSRKILIRHDFLSAFFPARGNSLHTRRGEVRKCHVGWLISTISFPTSFFLCLSRTHLYGCRSLCTLQGRFPRVERHVAGVGESGERGDPSVGGCDANGRAGGRVRKPRLARSLGALKAALARWSSPRSRRPRPRCRKNAQLWS